MRLLKESVLQIWKARKTTVREEIATAEQPTSSRKARPSGRGVPLRALDRHRHLRPAFNYLRPIETGNESWWT
ncbi:MAG: hypothetical protein R2712_00165 [Vicinamibacterales bacterium]